MTSNKKYGLILASARRDEARAAAGVGGIRKINVLRTSDDELEDDDPQEEQSRVQKRGEGNSAQQAQQRRLMREALEEDPSIFMYDEHYDQQQAQLTAVKERRQLDTAPKYIGRILESARRRELERDRCSVRKLQKERQAEGSIFQDKESFVTPAYSKKLQEIREADARDIMQAKVEEKNEAKKDTNRASFYKNLFEQRVMGDVPVSDAVIPSDDRRVDDQHPSDLRSPADRKADIVPRDTSRSRSRSPRHKEVPENPTLREARRTETNKSEDSSERVEFRKIKTNKSGDKTNAKRLRRLEEECSESGNESPEANDHINIKEEAVSSSECEASVEDPTPSPAKVAETREQRVERLFAKRTVGDKFVEAQQRYLIRKAERENA